MLSNGTLQRGAAIDLAAVAVGGGEAALEWAVGALEAASGQAPQVGVGGMLGGGGSRKKPFNSSGCLSANQVHPALPDI